MREGPYRDATGERCPDAIVEMLRERSHHDAMARAILHTIRSGAPWQEAVAEGLRFALEGREQLMGELERVLLNRAPLVVKMD